MVIPSVNLETPHFEIQNSGSESTDRSYEIGVEEEVQQETHMPKPPLVADVPAVQTTRIHAAPPPVAAAAPAPAPVAKKTGFWNTLVSLFTTEESAPVAPPAPTVAAPAPRGNRPERGGKKRHDRNEPRPERAERPERGDRPERGERPERNRPAPVDAVAKAATPGDEENQQRKEGNRRRRGGKNRNRERTGAGAPQEAVAAGSDLFVDTSDTAQARTDTDGPAPGKRPADKRPRPPRQRHRGNRDDLPQTAETSNQPAQAAAERMESHPESTTSDISDNIIAPLAAAAFTSEAVAVQADQENLGTPQAVNSVTVDVTLPEFAMPVSEAPLFDNLRDADEEGITNQADQENFVIPSVVTSMMSEDEVQQESASDVPAAAQNDVAFDSSDVVAEQSNAGVNEAQPADDAVPEVVPAQREKRRAPNDPRNRL